MKIGIAGPMSIDLLDFDFNGESVPEGYKFPMTSALVNGVLKKGHEVVAFTTSRGISEPVVFESDKLTICVAPTPEHPLRSPLFASTRKELYNLMIKYKVDVIHALWTYEFPWAAIDTGLPVVVTLQDHASTILKYDMSLYRFMRWCMNYIVLKKAKYLVANSQYMYDLLIKEEQTKASIINNFYSHDMERPLAIDKQKGNYIVSVSNGFGKRKNIGNAMLAFAKVRETFPDLQFYLLGNDMEENGPAHEFARKNNIEDGILFKGLVPFDQVQDIVQNAKICVHPSREESFGMSVLETMLLGTPLVGGDKSGNVPYLLDFGKAGILCDVDDINSIKEALLKLLQDEELSKNIIQNAYKHAVNNYSEDVIIDKYIKKYSEVLNAY
ncbi:glycosyltransferase family 4 protein [Chondrinema litorale]|uniref:glycosyltransferase family 4 protein n=1 Tax=Chondrinema litorale TaxID=2994555 RepID=UPI002542B839|nr:glycosyltransferase [Chondrinema litorale]UZR93202.1 glycosyltransferase [Chondrinema litorale]